MKKFFFTSFLLIISIYTYSQTTNYFYSTTSNVNSNKEILHKNVIRFGNDELSRINSLIKFGIDNNIQIGEWEKDNKLSLKAINFNFIGNLGINIPANDDVVAKLQIECPNSELGLYINHKTLKPDNTYNDYSYASQIVVDNFTTKAFTIHNTKIGKDVFTINGDGVLNTGGISTKNSIIIDDLSTWAWGFRVYAKNKDAKAFSVVDNALGRESFIVWGNGVVNATKIYAESFEVRPDALNIFWFDHVFNDNYQLMPLSELKNFVNTNKHLPDIPSEVEVKQNGIELFKMNALLLKKVEELTLYIIKMQEEIDALKKNK